MSIKLVNFAETGTQLGLDVTDGDFIGIRQVIWRGKSLRNTREPILPMICTADGWMADRYEFKGMEAISGGAVIVRTSPRFRVAPRMAWTESAMHPRVNTGSWGSERPAGSARLDWVLRPVTEEIAGVRYEGFSYGFRYEAPGCRIFQIEDRATWELGGEAEGNTFLMRNFFGSPIQRLTRDSAYDSGWTVPGIPNPYLFQHLPLHAQLQGFTFQYDDATMLMTAHERPTHIRSLFHKDARDSLLLHFHQFCFDITDATSTPERRILAAVRPAGGETGAMNHFLDLRQVVQSQLRTQAGILRFDIPRPSAHVETWEMARMENLPGVWRALYDWHIHRAYLMPLWRSNETDVAPRFAEDRERFNFMGNMCCPLELEIAECYGGWDGLKKAMAKAIELEIDAYMWFGSHFSSLSPLERIMPGLFARDAAGQHDRSQYGHVLFTVNQRNKDYQEYLVDRFKRLKECGISGVYRDSHFNMSCDTLHFAHDERGSHVQSMHEAELAIQRRFQEELGLLYYVDGGGIFGTPMAGTAYDFIHGQEMMYQDVETADLDVSQVQERGMDAFTAYYRGLSCRLIYQVGVELNRFPGAGAVSSWWEPDRFSKLLEGYARVEPHMGSLRMLDDGLGTAWRDSLGHEVVFPWRSMNTGVLGGAASITDVVDCRRVTDGEMMEPGHIYFREMRKPS